MCIVLFSPESSEQFEKAFPGALSSFERSLLWAEHIAQNSKIAVFCSIKNESSVKNILGVRKISVISKENWTTGALLEKMCETSKNDDFIVYANASSAFLDAPLAKKLIKTHTEYKAEYTFADGYPAGFAPEILDVGAASIISELCKTAAKEAGSAPVAKDAIFDVIKSDVNSFEIETEIASYDYRLLRLNFLCDTKLNLLAAKNLAEKLAALGKTSLLELDTTRIGEENVIEISNIAKEAASVLKTIPAFYNVQINCSCKTVPPFTPYAAAFKQKYGEGVLATSKRMSFEQFAPLADKIKVFSQNAVVSLSLWGEAALHPELHLFIEKLLQNGLTPLVEIDGSAAKEFAQGEVFKKISALAGKEKAILIVLLDAFEQKTYSALHGGAELQESIEAVKTLAGIFPQTYVQFTRTTQNEDELESFYRAWNEKSSATGGKLIIQKYDNFCGTLPSVKSADLAPVVREPCWHLRRDMEILFDGGVPLCREVVFEKILGNVFESPLEEIWQKKNSVLEEHIQSKYDSCCGKCDEYYTFNF